MGLGSISIGSHNVCMFVCPHAWDHTFCASSVLSGMRHMPSQRQLALSSSWEPGVVFRALEIPSKVHLESKHNPKLGLISTRLVGSVLSFLPDALGIICESQW